MTGSGKTSFVSWAANTPPPPEIAQLESCALGVTIASFAHGHGKTVHLIDTPGFNDTHRSDGEILQELAFWLLQCYNLGIRLSGIVYLHSITDPRMQGSTLRALNIFKKLVGPENFHGVILATTMWNKVQQIDYDRAIKRQQDLVNDVNFWGDLIQGQSQVKADCHCRFNAKWLSRKISKSTKQTLVVFCTVHGTESKESWSRRLKT